MSIQLGNSGRGTNGVAPLMSEEERLKSALDSSGEEERDRPGGAGSEAREAAERQAAQAQTEESDPEETDQQPGGGRWSESERPDSPESRWGGGR
jgi:hypothetical protein